MFKLTRQADADFAAIYAYGFDRFGQDQAERYASGLRKVFHFLADFPRAARERTETRRRVRAHPYKAHLIVYVLDGEDVLIVRIRHAHEEWADD